MKTIVLFLIAIWPLSLLAQDYPLVKEGAIWRGYTNYFVDPSAPDAALFSFSKQSL